MKLNQDCIRDLLLYLEENLNYADRLDIKSIKFKNYSSNELLYTTERLVEAGFINCVDFSNVPINECVVESLTYKGHQYLDTIRDNTIWAQTKKKLSIVASAPISVVQELSISVLKSTLNLP